MNQVLRVLAGTMVGMFFILVIVIICRGIVAVLAS